MTGVEPLASEATALPTESQPLPNLLFLSEFLDFVFWVPGGHRGRSLQRRSARTLTCGPQTRGQRVRFRAKRNIRTEKPSKSRFVRK